MKTTSSLLSSAAAVCPSRHRLFRPVTLLVSLGALTVTALAQPPAAGDAEGRNRRRERGAEGATGNTPGGRGNFDPAAMQEQMLTRMREQFAVTDDAEWALISERIAKVNEIRRTAAGGGRGGFPGGGSPGGGPGGPGGDRGGGRGPRPTGNPEVDSLRSAVTDKLPDAEIKSRLARLREVRKENEAKLSKAQEDLRSVLSVRQEAIAVMYGMLP